MTLEEAMDSQISRREVESEIKNHGLSPLDFFADVGVRDYYDGSEVLNWLGY